MRVVYAFSDGLEPGEVVRVDPQHDRLVILMCPDAPQDALARELSYAVTRHAQESWVWVGDVRVAS